MYKVIPGILEKNWSEIEEKINIAKAFSDTLHIDFIDGKFAPNTTFLDPTPFKKYASDLFLEAHLMVEEPINYLTDLSRAGFKRVIGQIEKMSDQKEFVGRAESLFEVGLAADAQTQVSDLNVPLYDLDCILIMTVSAGFSGQEFDPKLVEKIREISVREIHLPIEVDGGINDQTIILAQEAGAKRFVANSFIFNSPNPQEAYQTLVYALKEDRKQ
jgi:ribulose-phosphate 3-epimerase